MISQCGTLVHLPVQVCLLYWPIVCLYMLLFVVGWMVATVHLLVLALGSQLLH